MQLIDTHCHIHSKDYQDGKEAYARAVAAGVSRMICVGTDVPDSKHAVDFAQNHHQAFAAVGVHPHEAKDGAKGIEELAGLEKVVAIGEIGLDYFYTHSDRSAQIAAFEAQLQIAQERKLPVIFHVREAFDDFWPIFSQFRGITGVLHSFTDTRAHAEKGLSEGLLIGVNGISTFTKDEAQKELFRWLPLENIILETDSPYLTPAPWRGKVNEPAYVKKVAEHLSSEKLAPVNEIAAHTNHNATHLFHL
jgi:TatD DNase family protein